MQVNTSNFQEPQSIYRLEISARSFGVLTLTAFTAMIVSIILLLTEVLNVYPFLGLLACFLGLGATQITLCKIQVYLANKHNIKLQDLYGQSRMHQIFVEPTLLNIQDKKQLPL